MPLVALPGNGGEQVRPHREHRPPPFLHWIATSVRPGGAVVPGTGVACQGRRGEAFEARRGAQRAAWSAAGGVERGGWWAARRVVRGA
ncbi:hypothetical protein ACFPRL_21210 [Pseudoclavibacter helvolus]